MSILHGKTCIIRPLKDEDAEERLRYLNLREIERMMLLLPSPYTKAHHDAFMEKLKTDPSLLVRTIEAAGAVAGGIGLHDIIPGHKATMGYWLAPQYWGRGIMTEAISLVAAHAFKKLNLLRVQAYVFANNPASARAIEKAGFLCEGRLRNDVLKGGQVIDRFIYSKLSE